METTTTEQKDWMDEADKRIDDAWNLLNEKGLTLGERLKVRKAFAEWGKKFDDDIEFVHKDNVWRSKKYNGYGFETEAEVKFFNAIMNFAPEREREKVVQVASMVIKLLDIPSEWAFNSKK